MLLHVDIEAYKKELAGVEEFFAQFGNRLPARLKHQLDALRSRLG
jgi:phosphoenolpyruvate carboxykinase (GTP)